MVTHVIYILLLSATIIKSENCYTPDEELGDCISLYVCPKLIDKLQKGTSSDYEYVRKSRCGSTRTDPLVCCAKTRNCTTPTQSEGTCTSLELCPELIKVLSTKRKESVEYIRKSTCGITKSDIMVCCPLETQKEQSTVRSSNVGTQLVPSRKYCGYQHSDDYDVRGKGTALSEFPWLAGLNYITQNLVENIRCQGAIISARYILTAAHCLVLEAQFSSVNLKTVRLGEHHVINTTDCVQDGSFTECNEPVQEYGVEKSIPHPLYKSKPSSIYDIGLIRLNETIEYSDYVRPICLPLPEIKHSIEGDTLVTTGWGRTKSKSNAGIKKKILNTLISNNECRQIFETKFGKNINITEDLMCTKEHSDNVEFSCIGDSGGPVMFSHRSQWHVEGINSFGTSICGDKFPVVHTRVSKFLNWIYSNMEPW